MLTASHIDTALKAAGAGWGLCMSSADIAKAFNDAMLTYGEGKFDTTNKVAALISECMMESAYFKTTEEYAKDGVYAPFIGRTFIQITWESNYLGFGTWCHSKGLVPSDDYFVVDPTRLADLKWAALGGVWYFTQVLFSGKPLVDYADNIDQVGKAVNMGTPFSTAVPSGQTARLAAYIAVVGLGSVIVPTVPVVVNPPAPKPPVPPKEKVMYSSKWKTNYVSWRGGNFAPGTVAKLTAIPALVRVTQGGLSWAPASAMTHAGIGAFDLNTDGLTKDEVWELSRQLWEVNIIPCPRGFNADSFQGRTISNTNDGNEHLHCLDRDQITHMHPEAQAQCREIMAGGDGLMGNAHYNGPSKSYCNSWSASAYNPKNIRPGGTYTVVSGTLQGLHMDRSPKADTLRKKGYVVKAEKLVYRWGRWNAVTSSGTFYAVKDNKQMYMQLFVPEVKPVTPVPPVTPVTPAAPNKPVPAKPVAPKEGDVKAGGTYVVVSGTLQGLHSTRKPKMGTLRKKGYVIKAAKIEYRWGRWNAVTSLKTYYAISDKSQTYLTKK